MPHKGPSLDDPGNQAKFLLRLKACEYAAASRNAFTDSQEVFLKDMRYRFDTRDHDVEVGLAAWNPTVGQWNYLGDLYLRVAR